MGAMNALCEFRSLKTPCLVLIWKHRKDHWLCLYRMLIPISDCRGKLIRVPLGETKVTPGDPAWTPCKHADEGMMMNTPFRDGCHIRWDAAKLKMPAFVVFSKLCERVKGIKEVV